MSSRKTISRVYNRSAPVSLGSAALLVHSANASFVLACVERAHDAFASGRAPTQFNVGAALDFLLVSSYLWQGLQIADSSEVVAYPDLKLASTQDDGEDERAANKRGSIT